MSNKYHSKMSASDATLQLLRDETAGVETINMLTAPESMARVRELWNLYNVTSKRQRYLAILRHFSDDGSSYAAAISEWNLHHFQKVDETARVECICSETIQLLFFLINTRNGNILRVSSDCITKSPEPGLGERLIRDTQLILKQHTYKGDRRLCQACHNFTIGAKDPDWKTRCLSCYKEKRPLSSIPLLGGLPCATCQRPCLDPQATKKLKYCIDCYQAAPKAASSSSESATDKVVARSAQYEAYLESRKASFSSAATSTEASSAEPRPVAVEGRCCLLCRPLVLKGISCHRFHSLYAADDPRRYCPATEAVEAQDYQRARAANFKECEVCHEPKVHKGEVEPVCEWCRRE